MPKLSSSAVEGADYDGESRTLYIRYNGGDPYSYFDVPREVYQALLAAPSTGAFVNREIKPRYRFELESQRRRFRPTGE